MVEYTLGELLERGVQHGVYIPKSEFGRGSKVVKMGLQFSEDRIGPQEMERAPVSEEQQRRYSVTNGDLLFSRTSMIPDGAGKCSIVSGATEDIVVDSNIFFGRPKLQLVVPAYLFYYLNSPEGRSKVTELIGGTQSRSISGSTLSAMPVRLPPIQKQRQIAEVLWLLDDKIELNRRMNETLEAMARAIFRSWFVDFDPVRIKACGGDPTAELGLSPEIAALFPDSFQDSELGEIPSGWQVRELGDSIELAYGKALKAEVRVEGSVPVFGSNGQVGVHSEPLTSGPNVIVGRKGNPGFVTWCSYSCFVIDTAFFVLDRIGYPMSFWWLIVDGLKLQSQSGDSAVPGLSRAIAYRQKHILPPWPVAEAWANMIAPLRTAIDANIRENLTLAETRDYLLPLLLSGKIDVTASIDNERPAGTGEISQPELPEEIKQAMQRLPAGFRLAFDKLGNPRLVRTRSDKRGPP